jgi:SAM-dependent methyltransferase
MAAQREFDPLEPELMDRPQPVSEALRKDLANLEHLNRYWGSWRDLRRRWRSWLVSDRAAGVTAPVRVLDLATGSGDLARLLVMEARQIGRAIKVDAMDLSESTLEIARARGADYPEIAWILGDAREPQEAKGYDLAHCSLALHHFSEEDAVRVLVAMRLASRNRLLVSDLERGWFTKLGVSLLTTFVYREPMTVHDARVSARRAFSFAEFSDLVRRAEWVGFRHARVFACRQNAWVD